MRVGMAGAYGLDFSAVLALGAVRGADMGLLAEVLPAIEQVMLAALRGEEGSDDDG